ncbi:MAG: hypothetical protein HYT39_01405 [Candidatus Sungbacteria bacterium]|nr:hypothetical protein [Candidatus Sungbacteria bacterium]
MNPSRREAATRLYAVYIPDTLKPRALRSNHKGDTHAGSQITEGSQKACSKTYANATSGYPTHSQ